VISCQLEDEIYSRYHYALATVSTPSQRLLYAVLSLLPPQHSSRAGLLTLDCPALLSHNT
jgi:hypothetical protein